MRTSGRVARGAGFVLLALSAGACGARTGLSEASSMDAGADAPDASRSMRDSGRDAFSSVLDAGSDAGSDAGQDAAVDGGAAAPTCAPATALGPGEHCRTTIVVDSVVLSGFSCFVDLALGRGARAEVEWDCAGGGAVIVAPDARRFEGAFGGGNLDVCFGTEFDYSDGCHWTSAQRISGPLVSGGTLAMTYTEAPTTTRSCAPACSATGTISVGAF